MLEKLRTCITLPSQITKSQEWGGGEEISPPIFVKQKQPKQDRVIIQVSHNGQDFRDNLTEFNQPFFLIFIVPCKCILNVNMNRKSRVSNIMDYLLKQNYMQLRKRIFILCSFAGLIVIGETSISQNYVKIQKISTLQFPKILQ